MRSDSVGAEDAGAGAPERVAERYRVLTQLGRGGMGTVYHVVDESSGRELALKQLALPGEERRRAQALALFEREFHTLVQLSHPSVIEVYEYGVATDGPYYTMELLDGGDLRERSPLPWRTACALIYDACSSLGLLHSRRLVHRDVSPRNIRCTQAGDAKLIDFGAMAPMGPAGQLVGTPAFIAPEVVHRSSLDGRTDLYSLGATLYFALTGRPPYPARDLAGVLQAWSGKPAAPSLLITGIPAELDALVMSMISLEPALRPRSAFEVMQRLAAVAGLARAEPSGVSQAYLTTPVLVGRDDALATFRSHMQSARQRRGCGLLIEATAGLGRSRMLDACALEGKMLGAIVLRGSASTAHNSGLFMARALAEQLLDALPRHARSAARKAGVHDALFCSDEAAAGEPGQGGAEPAKLRSFAVPPAELVGLQQALAQWFLAVARQQMLLVAVDDLERVDEPSIALLAALVDRASRRHLVVIATVETAARSDLRALEVLASACARLPLLPLEEAESEALLTSVFGDVPNLTLLGQRIHAIAAGRPRECMALAQHLVNHGTIRYDGGTWTLPQELGKQELPNSAEELFRARIAGLGPVARLLAECQALSVDEALGRDDYDALAGGAPAGGVDWALDELLAREVLVSDGTLYTFSSGGLRAALIEGLDQAQQQARHRALAELYEQSGRSKMATALHLLCAGLNERAVDGVTAMIAQSSDREALASAAQMSYADTIRTLEGAYEAACILKRRPRERFELLRTLFALSPLGEDRLHTLAGPPLLARLELDSGLAQYREHADIEDPAQRLMSALKRAAERHAATPEDQRVYGVEEAIRHLVLYTVVSVAVGARGFDAKLISSLPSLLEPFSVLSPVLHALWQNALATEEASCKRHAERARSRWLAVYEQLGQFADADLKNATAIRNAVAYALGMMEAQLGLESAGSWAEVLDGDPLQRVNAMYLRKAVCLQRGDFDSAERFRRKAELLSVQATHRAMFETTPAVELTIHAAARDLTGVKQLRDRLARLAARYPGWVPYQHLAEAHFQRLRGDLEAARVACESALSSAEPDPAYPDRSIVSWPTIASAYLEILVELGRCEEARDYGQRVLDKCEELEIVAGAYDVARGLAMAEAKLGDYAGAAARLDAILDAQRALGVVGLNLGINYEARARIAIWAGDRDAVDRYGGLAAREYRHGRGSPLGARYERLLQEARTEGIASLPQLATFDGTVLGPTALGGVRGMTETSTTEVLRAADTAHARALCALRLLCDAYGGKGGHLYLVRDGGLSPSASLNADAIAQRGLSRHLESFFEQQFEQLDAPTAMLPDGFVPAVSTDGSFTDSQGVEYQTVLLSAVVDGEMLYVGVAALVPDLGRERSPGAAQITTVVSTFLVRSGDARGVAA